MNPINDLTDHPAMLLAGFGVSEADITPPAGIYFRNWGAAKFDIAIGTHKPLMMQCLAIEGADGRKGIILTADLGWWKNNADEQKIRNALLTHFGLDESQLLFCLSHTHAGPGICSNDTAQPGGEYILPYLQQLEVAAKQCIASALDRAIESVLTWNYGCCNLAVKRDLKVGNDYLVGYTPFETADQTLLTGQLKTTDGQLKAVVCNYACHPTSFAHGNRLLSPDFVGAMRETVTEHLSVPSIFLQGASGDLSPKKQYTDEPEVVDANGRKLGYAVLSAVEGAYGVGKAWAFDHALASGAPLAIWEEKPVAASTIFLQKKIEVHVPYKQLPDAAMIRQEYEQCEDRVLKDRLWRKLNTRLSIGDKSHATIPVWIWRLGDAVLVAQPNEAYSQYQENIRSAFPGIAVVFINIANGYIGYLPPKHLYDKNIYAVWQTPFAEGSLEILIETTRKEIEKILK